ncbi:MAG: hypothetical protein LBQ41_00560 [Candidatus Ancillula sp.]|jgi:hypothetical protein|nr:hypothetical protein [Candidatus Ancillula sp.]
MVSSKMMIRRRRFFLAVALLVVAVLMFSVVTLVQFAVGALHATDSQSHAGKHKDEELVYDGRICTASDLKLEAAVGQGRFQIDKGVTIMVRTINIGQSACKISTTPKHRVLTVQSYPETIYSSAGCHVLKDSGLLMSPGDRVEQAISWGTRRTGPDGCDTGDVARAGFYTATVGFPELGDVLSNEVSFYLE